MSESQRTTRINIRINDSVNEKLKRYSEELGMAPSTVAAQFLCEGLRNKEMQSKALQSAVDHQIKNGQEVALSIFSDPEKIEALYKGLGIDTTNLLDK